MIEKLKTAYNTYDSVMRVHTNNLNMPKLDAASNKFFLYVPSIGSNFNKTTGLVKMKIRDCRTKPS